MISMPQVQSIRRLRRNGESVASIARKTHVSEPTVRKYLAKEDLSAVPSVRKPRASVIDPYLPVIEQWLAEEQMPSHGPLAGKRALNGAATAYACIGPQCSLPVADGANLIGLLRRQREHAPTHPV